MTTPLPKIYRKAPLIRVSFNRGQQKDRYPICEAHLLSLLPTVIAKCSGGGSYTINGYNICPVHAGRVALDALAVPSEVIATKKIDLTARGQEMEELSSEEKSEV